MRIPTILPVAAIVLAATTIAIAPNYVSACVNAMQKMWSMKWEAEVSTPACVKHTLPKEDTFVAVVFTNECESPVNITSTDCEGCDGAVSIAPTDAFAYSVVGASSAETGKTYNFDLGVSHGDEDGFVRGTVVPTLLNPEDHEDDKGGCSVAGSGAPGGLIGLLGLTLIAVARSRKRTRLA